MVKGPISENKELKYIIGTGSLNYIWELEILFRFLNLKDTANALRSLGKDTSDEKIKSLWIILNLRKLFKNSKKNLDVLKKLGVPGPNKIDVQSFKQLAAKEMGESISMSEVMDAFRVLLQINNHLILC